MRRFYRALSCYLWLPCALLLLAMCGQSPLPANLHPIDGNLLVTFKDQAGEITLQLRTPTDHYSSSWRLEAVLNQFSDHSIVVDVHGIHVPGSGMNPDGITLRWSANLGMLDGTYDLMLNYRGQSDYYSFVVSATDIRMQASDSNFTVPLHDHWLRLPAETVWFLASTDSGSPGRTPLPINRNDYIQTVDRFKQQLQASGCTPMTLAPGVYAQAYFLAPWPETWEVYGHGTKIPAGDTGYTVANQPIVEYYQCSGTVEQRNRLVGYHSFPQWVTITVHAWGKAANVGYPEL